MRKKTLDFGVNVPANTPENNPITKEFEFSGLEGEVNFFELGFPSGPVTDLRCTFEVVKFNGSRFSVRQFYGSRQYFVADDSLIDDDIQIPLVNGDKIVLRAWNLDVTNNYELNAMCSVGYKK